MLHSWSCVFYTAQERSYLFLRAGAGWISSTQTSALVEVVHWAVVDSGYGTLVEPGSSMSTDGSVRSRALIQGRATGMALRKSTSSGALLVLAMCLSV